MAQTKSRGSVIKCKYTLEISLLYKPDANLAACTGSKICLSSSSFHPEFWLPVMDSVNADYKCIFMPKELFTSKTEINNSFYYVESFFTCLLHSMSTSAVYHIWKMYASFPHFESLSRIHGGQSEQHNLP